MTFSHPKADLFIPDGAPTAPAVGRCTHLGIGAHQDDLEFMALHGILECFRKADQWFGGVTCTDGAGSARSGPYAGFTDEAMKAVRVREQQAAALTGEYAFAAQLAHPSSAAKQVAQRVPLVDDLETILKATRPEIVYTHNPFDKHATHVGVLLATLEAVARLPADERPRQLLGCEVWRGLDWLPDTFKVVQPVDAHPNLAAALNGVFDSQITGGKRYDLAVEGRRLANATFFDSHAVDDARRICYAVDLTKLVGQSPSGVMDFCRDVLDKFGNEILSKFEAARKS